jgi:RNA polymerase sigma-70 factor (ECF subfamily)
VHEEQLDAPPKTGRPERWFEEHGDYLYAFAYSRSNDPQAAEDLVQETLLAALKATHAFQGQSSERTWLVGILKHKLIDWLRKTKLAGLADELNQPDEQLERLYDQTGLKTSPRDWRGDPAAIVEHQELWEAVQRCLAKLPDRLREVFTLRLLDDLPAPDVCQALGISATNLWTLMYRSRMRLWRCLDQTGFTSSDRKA